MTEEVNKLSKVINKNGFIYEQVKRTPYTAVYSQRDKVRGDIVSYEVFEIKESKPKTVNMDGQEVEFKGGERFPSDGDFGKTAFSVMYREHAVQKQLKINLKKHIKSVMEEYGIQGKHNSRRSQG